MNNQLTPEQSLNILAQAAAQFRGTTLTYAQVSAFVTAIAYQEKAAQAVPASS